MLVKQILYYVYKRVVIYCHVNIYYKLLSARPAFPVYANKAL